VPCRTAQNDRLCGRWKDDRWHNRTLVGHMLAYEIGLVKSSDPETYHYHSKDQSRGRMRQS